jgi:hypothetical protein
MGIKNTKPLIMMRALNKRNKKIIIEILGHNQINFSTLKKT